MEARRERKGRDEVLMKRLHIVYFLCREGRAEQPHLITVHHRSDNAVHLRDFKRWLSEFRGSEMPETFAWASNRRYRNGYIWQDLAEDDLIIPTSNQEYVLKGSFILSPIKIAEQVKEEEEAKSLAASSALESPLTTFQVEKNISPKPSVEVKDETSDKTLASTSCSSSPLHSPMKITKQIKEEKEAKSLAPSVVLKSSLVTFQVEEDISSEPPVEVNDESPVKTLTSSSSSSSEKADGKLPVFKIDYPVEQVKRLKKVRFEDIIPKENGGQFNGVKEQSSIKILASSSSSSSEKAVGKHPVFKIDYPVEQVKRLKKVRFEDIIPKENGGQFNGVKEQSSIKTLASTSSSSSEKAERKIPAINIDCWKEEMKRLKKLRCEENTLNENRKFNRVKKEIKVESLASTSSSNSEKTERKTPVIKDISWKEEMKRLKKLRCKENILEENRKKFIGANEESSVEALASTSSSSSKKAERKIPIIKIDCWKEEMKRLERLRCEEIIAEENGRQFNRFKTKESHDNRVRKWASVLKKLLRCRTVETEESII